MKLIDCRRLTGPSIIWNRPGSIADVECASDQIDPLVSAWEKNARKMLDAVGWYEGQTMTHRFSYGVSLALSSPIDAMYAATELNEWAFNASVQELGGDAEDFVPFSEAIETIQSAINEEINPALISLKSQADQHRVVFLSDDDEVSLGFGKYSETWPVTKVPSANTLTWSNYKTVPVGLVTGTNGKTTSVRLAVKIARAAGHQVGLSSTDWVAVNDRVIDHGDYSGPGGARTVLRDQEVDMAILETARGGMLRRGLGVERADAALITNIAEDHLGDFGSKSVDELLDVKWVVSKVLDDDGLLILNADDERLVAKSKQATAPIAWFSLDEHNPVLQKHQAAGGVVATVRAGMMSIHQEGVWQDLCPLSQIPITLGGIAKHNVSNALGAVLLTAALGVDHEFIVEGLRQTQANDNPGRCNLYQINDATVLVDFAHNPDGMQAIFQVASELPAKRRLLCFAQ
ncbi:MAG: Mur ligase family protein, partial [Pseudomonadota bacterium]